MSLGWIQDKISTKAEDVIIHVLSAGPIPQHVAFVMDGNRRYARLNHKQTIQGHTDGFMALRRILQICLRLKIRCVTAYAFAIDNFKRSPEEVDALMALAEEKLLEICQHGDLLDKDGVRLNVLGRKELLPIAVQNAARKAEDLTRHNDRAIFNLCMPYASRDEMTTAVQSTVRIALQNDPDTPLDISEKDVERQLMTSVVGSPPLDILIRTSGVKRLSDFLLWQCCESTQLHFTSAYWPEFGLWDFVPMILDYQQKVWMKAPAKPKSGDLITPTEQPPSASVFTAKDSH